MMGINHGFKSSIETMHTSGTNFLDGSMRNVGLMICPHAKTTMATAGPIGGGCGYLMMIGALCILQEKVIGTESSDLT